MSQISTEHGPGLIQQWSKDGQVHPLGAVARGTLSARALSLNLLDKLITSASIVLLAPAIVAVWIAIKRSGSNRSAVRSIPQPVIGHQASSAEPAADAAVLLTIKPAIQAISA